MIRYLLISALALSMVGNVILQAKLWTADQDRARLERATGALASCNRRIQVLLNDQESDNAIDTLPDGALRTAPDHWLLPH